jgi:heme exporter protein D
MGGFALGIVSLQLILPTATVLERTRIPRHIGRETQRDARREFRWAHAIL